MYIILELQVNGDDVGTIVTKKESIEEAKSTFYAILSAAAISPVERHSAVLLDDEGKFIQKETFYHLVPQAGPIVYPE